MTERTIVGALIADGRMYRAGDEDAFAAANVGRDLSGLIASGHLTGAWDTTPAPTDAPTDAPAPAAKKTTHRTR